MKLAYRFLGKSAVGNRHKKPGYPYQALTAGRNEIRLLTLKAGKWNCPLEGQLYQIPLKKKRVACYWALSYTWGDPNDKLPISLNGIPFEVTRNLWTALRHLRLETEDRDFWIDAICTNQNDIKERSEQVRKMQMIYQLAGRVVTWLGEAKNSSDEAMTLMKDLGDWFDSWIENAEDESQEPEPASVTLQAMRDKGFEPAERNWKSLWDLWDREYWSRIWIVQEIAAAQDDGNYMFFQRAQIVCGQITVPMRSFVLSILFLYQYLIRSETFEFETDTIRLDEPFRTMHSNQRLKAHAMSIVFRTIKPDKPVPILNLLELTKSFQATDPRDKIFALLGLSTDTEGFLADYSKDITQVSEELVEFHIAQSKTLDILLGNRRCQDDSMNLPSWVQEPYGIPRILPGGKLAWGYWYQNGHASADLPPRISIEPGKGKLKVEGVKFGVVDMVIGPFEEFSMPQDASEVISRGDVIRISGWERPGQELHRYGRSLSDEQRETFMRTLLLNLEISTMQEFDSLSNSSSREWMHLWINASLPMHNRPHPNAGESRRQWDLFNFVDNQVVQTINNRTYFTTDTGISGLGPLTCKPGDIVTIMCGSRMCLILRPVGAEFRLVGDAYAHGLMKGDGMTGCEGRTLEMESFSIY